MNDWQSARLIGVPPTGNGEDCALYQVPGMWGRNGQNVPVRVGQLSTRFNGSITVSGQALATRKKPNMTFYYKAVPLS